jgi:SagB-type dehydrogenase family enzyme
MPDSNQRTPGVITLPPPSLRSPVSIEEALLNRRSVRSYRGDPLTLEQTAQLLWAVQGITSPNGFRTAPSAGPCYPLETYVAAGAVTSLPPGVYRYQARGHRLEHYFAGDVRRDLAAATLGQEFLQAAPMAIVFSARPDRTTRRYGERGNRYVYMDVGHAGENLHLQAVSLGLGTVVVGAFKDDEVKRVMRLPAEEHPLYIMPVGRPS